MHLILTRRLVVPKHVFFTPLYTTTSITGLSQSTTHMGPLLLAKRVSSCAKISFAHHTQDGNSAGGVGSRGFGNTSFKFRLSPKLITCLGVHHMHGPVMPHIYYDNKYRQQGPVVAKMDYLATNDVDIPPTAAPL